MEGEGWGWEMREGNRKGGKGKEGPGGKGGQGEERERKMEGAQVKEWSSEGEIERLGKKREKRKI